MAVQERSWTTGRAWKGALLAVTIGLLAGSISGCAKPRLIVQRPILAGPYRGATEDGKAVEVTFREDREAFRGEGTIGGEPVVVAGAMDWHGVASLARANGGTELVAVTLSADAETVLLERSGQAPVTLQRGGSAPPPAPDGPFSGSYRAEREGAPLAQVTLVQRGTLLAGVGVVAGDAAGITGLATGPSAAAGLVTFQDGSQIRFQAELAAAGDTLTLRGFGDPISMRRGGRR